MTTQSSNSTAVAGDGINLSTTQPDATSHEVAVKRDSGKPDDPSQQESTTKIFVLISVFLSMFLVGLDRTIISTVWIQPIEQSLHSDDFCSRPARVMC